MWVLGALAAMVTVVGGLVGAGRWGRSRWGRRQRANQEPLVAFIEHDDFTTW